MWFKGHHVEDIVCGQKQGLSPLRLSGILPVMGKVQCT